MKKFISLVRLNAWIVTCAFSVVLLFSACNKSGNENDNTPVSGLMAFNLAPDLSLAGFAISGNNLTPSPLAFNNYTGVYLRIYPGSRSLESYNFSSGAALATTTYNFEASKYYSVFLAGTDSGYQNIIVNDNIDSLTPSTQAFARYVNAIPDASAPTVTITSNGSNVVNDNASFTSVSEFTAINPGPVTINVSNGGTINANRTITLEQGKVYTLLLSGRPGGTGDNAVQIKYIQNGTVDASADKVSSSSARSIN